MYRRFKTTSGKEILIGKNAEENDYLSTEDKDISGEYIWMHVAGGLSGSHLILQDCYDNVTEEDLKEAAGLAAYYSKAKNLYTARVHHCLRKNVEKKEGSNPGEVLINNWKVIYTSPAEGKRIINGEESNKDS